MSKPRDGTATGRWSDFAQRDLFAHVAVRCFADYAAEKTVSVSSVLRDLAAKGFPFERHDYEPRAKLEAATAARAAGDSTAIQRALASGAIRRRSRQYRATKPEPLRDAFYNALDALRSEGPAQRAAPASYYQRCLTSIALLVKDWSADEGHAAKILEFILTRPDTAE